MNSVLRATLALAAVVAVSGGANVAHAQTEEDCAAGIEEVNQATTGEQGVTESARNEARTLSEQASNAQSEGDYARCMELVEQAQAALGQ